jgi:hypothetical protein
MFLGHLDLSWMFVDDWVPREPLLMYPFDPSVCRSCKIGTEVFLGKPISQMAMVREYAPKNAWLTGET